MMLRKINVPPIFAGGGEDNSFMFQSLRSGHFFTKILYCMQYNLLNTLTKFQGSICKNVNVTNEKTILIARLTKNQDGL
jgi:hypothetical protein